MHGAPPCVTVNVCAPIVIVPVRLVMDGFAATEYVTVPLPVPVVPAVTAIHGALLAAVHWHEPAFAVTDTVPVPPADVGELAVGEIASVQTTAACVTLND